MNSAPTSRQRATSAGTSMTAPEMYAACDTTQTAVRSVIAAIIRSVGTVRPSSEGTRTTRAPNFSQAFQTYVTDGNCSASKTTSHLLSGNVNDDAIAACSVETLGASETVPRAAPRIAPMPSAISPTCGSHASQASGPWADQ